MTKKKIQLPLQTVSLIGGFMVWVILSSLIPYIKEDISLTASQLSMVTAIPVILGSLLRIPIGFWTNRFGARNLFSISFLLLVFPIYFLSIANSYTHLVIGGLFLGLSGAVFSVGVTSLPKYYPKEKHGFVNGIYGAGNIGTAITTFCAPVLATKIGWQQTIQVYIILVLVLAILNFIFGDKNEPRVTTSLSAQIRSVYKNNKLWALSLFYFLTFGSFVAFTVFLPNFFVSYFELSKVNAGLITAGLITLATIMRPIGGWLADRFNSFNILIILFIGFIIGGAILAFDPSLVIFCVAVYLIGLCAGLGNGTVFKLVPLYFSKEAGIVNGIVSAMGGLGGFFPPLLLSYFFNHTGSYLYSYLLLILYSFICFIVVRKLMKEQTTI